jgi:hypothetical protein
MDQISNNKESVLDVAKRLEWLSRAKAIAHRLDTDESTMLANIVHLQKHLFEQTLVLNKIKKIQPNSEDTWKRLQYFVCE